MPCPCPDPACDDVHAHDVTATFTVDLPTEPLKRLFAGLAGGDGD